jgi:hypothetical protein
VREAANKRSAGSKRMLGADFEKDLCGAHRSEVSLHRLSMLIWYSYLTYKWACSHAAQAIYLPISESALIQGILATWLHWRNSTDRFIRTTS